jgi:hypothetical protein
MEVIMKLKIKAFIKEVPKEATIAGKIDCYCNTCKKKTFHYLYESGTQFFARCLRCGETFVAEEVATTS